jgi:ATP-dependent DNA ligase
VPLRNELVAEVSFDQLAEGRFRHGARFERWRIDKPPEECTLDQIDPPEGAGFGEVVGD